VRAVEAEQRIPVEDVEILQPNAVAAFEDVLDDAQQAFGTTPDDDISLIRPAPIQLRR
jgi:hypothetical protein